MKSKMTIMEKRISMYHCGCCGREFSNQNTGELAVWCKDCAPHLKGDHYHTYPWSRTWVAHHNGEECPFHSSRGWLPESSHTKKTSEWVMVLTEDGEEIKAHWAADYSGEYQPAFEGWFKENGASGFVEVDKVIAWKPIPTDQTTESA